MNHSEKIKLVLIDDHALFREGLKSIFASENDITVVGEADDGDTGLKIINATQPDIVLLDIGIPGISGLEVCRQIRTRFPEVKTIILSMYKTDKYLAKAITAGALGYISKQGVVDELTMGIRAVFAGKKYIGSDMAGMVMERYNSGADEGAALRPESILSDRETEIVRLVTQGWDNERIGAALHISPTTVKTHRARVMKKLDLHNASDLVMFALKNGIIELE